MEAGWEEKFTPKTERYHFISWTPGVEVSRLSESKWQLQRYSEVHRTIHSLSTLMTAASLIRQGDRDGELKRKSAACI
jgi:hypothetical protein